MGVEEVTETFECFGSSCTILLSTDGDEADARAALARGRQRLESWHERFSRFVGTSELSLVNDDPRERVEVSEMMAAIAQAALMAASMTDGLVDATMIDEVERAGYGADLLHPLPLALALGLAPERRPAAGAFERRWRGIDVDMDELTITRPPGLKLDSGGLAKGLFADALAGSFAARGRFAVNCAGDLSIGGREGAMRPVRVESPFGAGILHTFELRSAGVATSGIGRRSWLDESGRPAHHLLDPSTGRPAYTGIVQVTALAPTALLGEIRAKAALLSGPEAAPGWLPDGGVIVLDDGSHSVLEPAQQTLSLGSAVSDAGR